MHNKTFNSVVVTSCAAILMLCFVSSAFGRSGQATVDDLQVGQTVAIEGKSTDARTIQASEVEIQQASQQVKLKGRIQNIDTGTNSLVLLGTRVLATQDAQIADRVGGTMPFSNLQKGLMVKVKGQLHEEGVLHASEIKLSREEAPDEAEVEGRVQSLNKAARTLTVTGLTIRLTPSTKITFD